jgi:hypothetical protein
MVEQEELCLHKQDDTATGTVSFFPPLLVLALCSSCHLWGVHFTTTRSSVCSGTLGLHSYRLNFVGERLAILAVSTLGTIGVASWLTGTFNTECIRPIQSRKTVP